MRAAVALIFANEENLFMSHDFGSIIECFKSMVKSEAALHCHSFIQVSTFDIFYCEKNLRGGLAIRISTGGYESPGKFIKLFQSKRGFYADGKLVSVK